MVVVDSGVDKEKTNHSLGQREDTQPLLEVHSPGSRKRRFVLGGPETNKSDEFSSCVMFCFVRIITVENPLLFIGPFHPILLNKNWTPVSTPLTPYPCRKLKV